MKKIILAICLNTIISSLAAQPKAKSYSLQEIVNLARRQSPFALQAETSRENKYWQYRSFRSNYNPQLSLGGTLPDFRRQVRPITQPDGTIIFIPVLNNLSGIELRLSQVIAPTGGTVYVSSGLDRFDNFSDDPNKRFVQYNSVPAQVGIYQPLFGFNPFKWDKKIEPLRYQESIKGYAADMEDISLRTVNLAFDLILAQADVNIATKNSNSSDTLMIIAQARYEKGRISRNEWLQLKLQKMNAEKDLAQAELDLEMAILNLNTYVGLAENESLILELPDELPDLSVEPDHALQHARQNRPEVVAFRRRQLEAQQEVARAKGNSGFQADLQMVMGINNQADILGEVFDDPINQQAVQFSFDIPILDWGRAKSRKQTALANQRLVEYSVAQEQISFDQQIITQVKQFNLLSRQVVFSLESDKLAQERYKTAVERFQLGDISITDLNLAQLDKDQAARAYVSALRTYWNAYFNLRLLTLYDFESETSLINTEE